MPQLFRKNYGFSLPELLVSIGIMLVILSIVLSKQSTYTDGVALTGDADELGLSLVQAQVYGIGVREFSPGSGSFGSSYGISVNLLSSGSNSSYIFFADRNGNGFYDGDWSCPIGETSECLSKTNLTRGNNIDQICVVRSQGSDQCNTVSRIDSVFLRPNTRTQLTFFNSGGQEFEPSNIIGGKVTLVSPAGKTASVVIYETGQVSIQ